jgi:hypothetical protein
MQHSGAIGGPGQLVLGDRLNRSDPGGFSARYHNVRLAPQTSWNETMERNEPDADGLAPCHEPVPVVFYLVNPSSAGRGLIGWGWQPGFYKTRPVRVQALTHELDRHATNVGATAIFGSPSSTHFLSLLQLRLVPRMSAIPPTAAEKRTSIKVRFVPEAAVSNRSKAAPYSITSSARC